MNSNPFVDVLSVVCGHLESIGLRYAVTGSLASSIYGEPMTTQDVDICLHMTSDEAAQLDDALPRRFYRSRTAMMEAVQHRTMANLIDTETGLKIDLSVLPDEPYYDTVLTRCGRVSYDDQGHSFWTVSPEDIILMKLLWRLESRSEKQWENALSVVRVSSRELNWSYLREWAGRLNLSGDLISLRNAAGI